MPKRPNSPDEQPRPDPVLGAYDTAVRQTGERIARAINTLYGSYTQEGVGQWLVRRRPQLHSATPLGILAEGRVDEFVALCEATGEMVAT